MYNHSIKPMISETPWGPAQVVTELAPGIVRIDTASHGGILLDEVRMAALPSAIAAITTWCGGNAFEEDCDAALVTLAFPDTNATVPTRSIPCAVLTADSIWRLS
jgi:hypothetical protein